jgi:hypothetical protein
MRMPKKKFSDRRNLNVYLEAEEYRHMLKICGKNVSAFVRELILRELQRKSQ